MQVTNPVSPVTTTAPVGAARPADNTKNTFASLLRQTRSEQAAPPEACAQGSEAAADDTADAQSAPVAPVRARLKTAEKPGPQRPAERGPKIADGREPTPETAAQDPAGNTHTKRSDMPAAEPALAPWLLASAHALPVEAVELGQAEADTAPASAGDSLVGAKADDTAALRDAKAGTEAQARRESAAASQEGLAQWASSTRADSAATQRVGQALAEGSRGPKAVATETSATSAALGAAAFNPLLGAARESAAPLAVNLPTPLASPEFAQALGVQMSVLAADGVERAELQLNPAEMGPVSVQIVIEGTSARVDFGADLAATRHAIEAGLPELAGALRDAGFTLTGGGVSQHSGGRGGSPQTPGDGGHGDRHGAGADGGAVHAAPQRRNVAAGGVDLYA